MHSTSSHDCCYIYIRNHLSERCIQSSNFNGLNADSVSVAAPGGGEYTNTRNVLIVVTQEKEPLLRQGDLPTRRILIKRSCVSSAVWLAVVPACFASSKGFHGSKYRAVDYTSISMCSLKYHMHALPSHTVILNDKQPFSSTSS